MRQASGRASDASRQLDAHAAAELARAQHRDRRHRRCDQRRALVGGERGLDRGRVARVDAHRREQRAHASSSGVARQLPQMSWYPGAMP